MDSPVTTMVPFGQQQQQTDDSMALVPMERFLPVNRSPFSLLRPGWEVGQWTDFNSHLRQMEQHMKDMKDQMSRMFQHFHRLAPMAFGENMPRMPAPLPVPGGRVTAGCWSNTGPGDWGMQHPIVEAEDGSRKMRIQLDVRQFKPAEIDVKTVDNKLVIHAKHHEGSDTSKLYREYQRQYLLPRDVEPETVTCSLSPEGVLTLEAPMRSSTVEVNIPIAIE